MKEEMRSAADRRFEAALRETGARDPREFYRELLRQLREASAPAYRQALEYFETRLTPAVAAEDSDPIAEWMAYGCFLAKLTSSGETVQIDASGRSAPFAPPTPLDHMVLHLPTSSRDRALPVGLPPRLSPAQRAAYELLVQGKVG